MWTLRYKRVIVFHEICFNYPAPIHSSEDRENVSIIMFPTWIQQGKFWLILGAVTR